MRTLEFRRVLLTELPALEAEGWEPATSYDGQAVMVLSYSEGFGQSVLVSRTVDEDESQGRS